MLKMQLISPCWQGRIPEWYDGGKKNTEKLYTCIENIYKIQATYAF